MFFWINRAWYDVQANAVNLSPDGDNMAVEHEVRAPDRNISPQIKAAVPRRDGYRCRYCGLAVVHADVRKPAHRLYSDDVPWNARDIRRQHTGFAAS